MKFKVGDKVKIARAIFDTANTNKAHFVGKTRVVKNVLLNKYVLEDIDFLWLADELELVED